MELALAIMPGFIWHILFANRCGFTLKSGVWEFLAPVLLASVFWFFIACVLGYYYDSEISACLIKFRINNFLDISKIATEKQNAYLITKLLQASFYSFVTAVVCSLNPIIENMVDKAIAKDIDFKKAWYTSVKEFYFVIYVLVLALLFLVTYPLRLLSFVAKEITCIVYAYSDRELQKFLKFIIKKNTDDKNSGVMIVLSNDHFYIGKIVEADLSFQQDGNGVIQILTLASGKIDIDGESSIRTTYKESHKLNRLIFIREILTIKDFNLNDDSDIVKVKSRIDPTNISPLLLNYNQIILEAEAPIDYKKATWFIALLILTIFAIFSIFTYKYYISLTLMVVHALVVSILRHYKKL